MVYKKFFFITFIHIIFIVINVFLIFWSALLEHLKFTVYGFCGILILQIIYFIYSVNKNNKNIQRFLEMFVIEDSFPKFKNTFTDKSFINLQNILNSIAESYGQVKVDKEADYQFFKSIFEHINIGLIIFDTSGTIILCNKTAKDLLSIKSSQSIDSLNSIYDNFSNILIELQTNSSRILKFSLNNKLVQLSIVASEVRVKEKNYKIVS